MNSSEERLGTEKLPTLILSMGIPTLIAQVINLLYNIVDRMYIGHIAGYGAQALTGLGVTMPVILLISAFSSLIGAGGAPLASIAMGQGKKDQAKRILGNGFVLLCCMSLVLMILFFLIKRPFLYTVGASDITYPYAAAYLNIYLTGTPFVQLVLGLNPYISAQGRPKTAMLSVAIGAVLNIALDPIFIFVLNLGVRGAALATILSQAASAAWVLRYLTDKNTSLRLERSFFAIDNGLMGRVVSLGISPFIMQSTESLIVIVMSSGLQRYGGDLYVGSLTILQSCMQLISTPILGFAQGVQPVVSYNFGAGNRERVKKTYRMIISLTTGVSFLMTVFIMLFPGILAGLFTNDTELTALVRRVLPVFISGMLIFGLQMGCQNVFMGLGQAKISLFIALLRKVFLLIPFAILFPRITGSVNSIYYAECTADFLAAAICGILFALNIRKILDRGPSQIRNR